jgi:hypothetical protein
MPVIETTARCTLISIVIVYRGRMLIMEGRAWDMEERKINTRLLPRVNAILSLAYGRSTPELQCPALGGLLGEGILL